jgi:hypothetical protein
MKLPIWANLEINKINYDAIIIIQFQSKRKIRFIG